MSSAQRKIDRTSLYGTNRPFAAVQSFGSFRPVQAIPRPTRERLLALELVIACYRQPDGSASKITKRSKFEFEAACRPPTCGAQVLADVG